jgi:predicted MFS family arabinose efflux permease
LPRRITPDLPGDTACNCSKAPPMIQREISRLLAAEGISNFGAMLSRLAIPWLAALTLQATPAQMAALLVADVVAAALGATLLGGWVDRRPKRRLMLAADAMRALLLGGLALAAGTHTLTFTILLPAAAASGVLTLAFELARSAWIAQRVAHDDLPRRNAQLAMAASLSETAAFALGGWLYQALGAALALAVDAASYVVSALCLKGISELPGAAPAQSRPAASAARVVWAEATEGLRIVANRPRLTALAVIDGLMAFAGALFGTSYMIFVSRDIALPTGVLGMIFALGSLGALIGAFVAPRLGLRFGSGRTMAMGLLLTAIGAALVPMVQRAGWIAIALLATHQIVGDAGHTVHDVHGRSLRQTAVAPAFLARADAGVRTVEHAATLAGALVGGVWGTAFGTRGVLWLAVGCSAAAAVWAAMRLARKPHPGRPYRG